jgi:hypothetical protein
LLELFDQDANIRSLSQLPKPSGLLLQIIFPEFVIHAIYVFRQLGPVETAGFRRKRRRALRARPDGEMSWLRGWQQKQ